MKKLLPIVLVFAIAAPILILLSRNIGLRFSLHEIVQKASIILGWSMIVVGTLAILISIVITDGKDRIYQGFFCTLLGVAISTYSLTAFISAIALVAWLDHKGRSLN